MCGIAGIYNLKGVEVAEVVALSQTLKHRGPDDEGFMLSNNEHFENCSGNDTIAELKSLKHLSEVNFTPSLALVHRRLSIIDVSALGHQPLLTPDQRYTIVFNGEVYNFKEIRQELKQKGHSFKSDSDTEVVLTAFAVWGAICVNRFVGMWAFVVFDKQENTLTLSRDRFGIKPLYYFKNQTYFAFASEIKALLKLKDVDKSISNKNLGSYLAFGTTANPYQNLFQHIVDVEPGCNYQLDLNTNQLTKTNYFSIDDKLEVNNNDIKTNTQKFEELFTDSIGLHLRSDVEIGSCLSGGLDSSAIVYSASKQLNDTSLKTFTAAYQNKTIDESDYAKLVAKDLPNVTDIYTYPEAKTLVADMDKLIYAQDLPIGSTSIFGQWEVMKCVGENNIKVLLDGQGADEILGGYYNFAGIHLIELLKSFKFNRFFKEYYQLKQNFTPQIKNAVLRAAYYYLPESLQQQLRAKERLSYNFINPGNIKELDLLVPKRGGKTFDEHVNLSVKFGMYELLRYEDRNSMAFSIESRVPFLDHRLVEFIRALPTNQKIHGGWTKYILRKMLNDKLNDKVVWRKDKKGFVTPQQDWKNELIKTLTTELKQSNLPSIMNKNYVLQLCDKDLSNATHLSEFWRAYSVIKWYNTFNLRA
ncbi:MAG: asparagine synthase (glutamine-hydrolyzing) [Bacteroidetes bacterium]|nr:asparagine synthase (glutamine-hydrolyzing) [Bacteroidota bacterium]